jgi:hypothetical protein
VCRYHIGGLFRVYSFYGLLWYNFIPIPLFGFFSKTKETVFQFRFKKTLWDISTNLLTISDFRHLIITIVSKCII